MPDQKTDQRRQNLPGQGKTIFVTGIAGFIGARVAEMLLEQGYKVVGIDNLNDYYDVRLKFYRLAKLFGGESLFKENFDTNSAKVSEDNYKFDDWINIFPEDSQIKSKSDKLTISNKTDHLTFHLGDIENQNEVNKICEEHNPTAIINLAARAGVRASIEDPHAYLSTNTLGCLNLLEAAKKFRIRKFILASTSSLYAGQPMPFNEDFAVNQPLSPYSASKKAAEAICYTYNHLYNISITVLRYFTVYGPAGRPDMSILRFIKWIHEGNPIKLYGDGTQSRDFTYIDDIVRGTISGLKLENMKTINLGGGGKSVSLNEVIKQIEKTTNLKVEVQYNKFHNSDIIHTLADNDLAINLLSWDTKFGFTEGLEKTIKWFKANESWCSKITI